MANEKKSATTVTVLSKLPAPLILRVFEMVDTPEPVMGGGQRMVKQARELPQRFTINGCAHPQNAAPNCELAGGFAITPNVPKDIWDKWLSQNKESDMVKKGIVFAQDSLDSARDAGADHKDQKSGLERLVPKDFKKVGLEPDKDHMNKETLNRVAA